HERLAPRDMSLPFVSPHRRPPFVRHAHDWYSKPRGEAGDDGKDRRKRVDVLVRIEMRHRQAFGADAVDLRSQLPLDVVQGDSASQARKDERFPRGEEPLIAAYKGRHTRWRQYGDAIDQRQMDADAERRSRPAPSNGIGGGWRVGEHARAGDNA